MSAAAFFPGQRRARDQQPRLVHVIRFAAAPRGSGAQTRAQVLQAVERVLRPLPLHTTLTSFHMMSQTSPIKPPYRCKPPRRHKGPASWCGPAGRCTRLTGNSV